MPEPDPDAEILLEAMARAGLDSAYVAWDDPGVQWSAYDLLVLRSCWNYHLHFQAFRDWLERVESHVEVKNPPETIRWNMDKSYLRDLEKAGVKCVPTLFVRQGEAVCLRDKCSEKGWGQIVVKPTISAGSWMTQMFDCRDAEAQTFLDEILSNRPAMVQPYLESVNSVGERSVMVIGSQATHVVVKKPRFHGSDESVSEAIEPTDFEREIVKEFREMPQCRQTLYMRVDLICDANHNWCLSELELIEPSLFLEQNPAAAESFADEIKKTVSW